ncbi:hypothetical protein PIB30_050132 [Stylosanthes scabra]|uniref:Uncharacterized protein n=1 Tax=Stylosanthes scabra TaxID=79078 RepID=A0ABU6VIK1_9FABA|nr:hypothetical protein [Stylosanthes scabra]
MRLCPAAISPSTPHLSYPNNNKKRTPDTNVPNTSPPTKTSPISITCNFSAFRAPTRTDTASSISSATTVVSPERLKKYVFHKICSELQDGLFCVVYMNSTVQQEDNSPGITILRWRITSKLVATHIHTIVEPWILCRDRMSSPTNPGSWVSKRNQTLRYYSHAFSVSILMCSKLGKKRVMEFGN